MTRPPLYDIAPPIILADAFPEEERAKVRHIGYSLAWLSGRHNQFAAALSLFEFAEQRQEAMAGEEAAQRQHPRYGDWWAEALRLANWQFVAARDGAMSIYHFARTMQGIRASLNGCPTFKGKVDHEKLRSVSKSFRQTFPSFEGIRHGIAHSAELVESIDRFERNAFTGAAPEWMFQQAYERLMLTGALYGHNFTLTWEGRLLSYEIHVRTLENLRRLVAEFFSGFASVAADPAEVRPFRFS
jgi:hypothetical protein